MFRFAARHGLVGFVRNMADAGVEVVVEGDGEDIEKFINSLRPEQPPLARIDDIRISWKDLKSASDGVKLIFKWTLSFKGALVLRDDKLSTNITTFSLRAGRPIGSAYPNDNSQAARMTADALNEFVNVSHEILKNHSINLERKKRGKLPANILLPWGGGDH